MVWAFEGILISIAFLHQGCFWTGGADWCYWKPFPPNLWSYCNVTFPRPAFYHYSCRLNAFPKNLVQNRPHQLVLSCYDQIYWQFIKIRIWNLQISFYESPPLICLSILKNNSKHFDNMWCVQAKWVGTRYNLFLDSK